MNKYRSCLLFTKPIKQKKKRCRHLLTSAVGTKMPCSWDMQLGHAVGTCSWKMPLGKCCWDMQLGHAAGKCRWENAVGKMPMGKCRWENAVKTCSWDTPLGKCHWENAVGKMPLGKCR